MYIFTLTPNDTVNSNSNANMNITIATLSPSSAKMFQKGSIKFGTVNPSGTVKSCHTAGLDNTIVEGTIVPPNRVLNGLLKSCKKYFFFTNFLLILLNHVALLMQTLL